MKPLRKSKKERIKMQPVAPAAVKASAAAKAYTSAAKSSDAAAKAYTKAAKQPVAAKATGKKKKRKLKQADPASDTDSDWYE
jgi:hypothetical protein